MWNAQRPDITAFSRCDRRDSLRAGNAVSSVHPRLSCDVPPAGIKRFLDLEESDELKEMGHG